MKNLFTKLILALNLFLALTLGLAYLAPYLSPSAFWFISVIGLGQPFLLVLNALFVIYWLFRFKKYFIVSLIAIGLGYFHFGKLYRWNDQKEYPPIESVKLLSHNIRAFGLNGPEFDTKDGKKIFRFLDTELYDVYCFQEFFDTGNYGFHPYDSVKKITGAKYRHVEFLIEFRGNQFGIATLSRYPIVDKGVVDFEREGTNLCIYTDIDFNGKIVRVYNMHLQSLGFRQKDLEFVKSIGGPSDQTLEGTRNIVSRFKHSFIKREEQAKKIRNHIEDCPYPVIVCGDFNDTPLSYSYQHIKGNLVDAYMEKGKGLGSTYNGIFPLLRIDYIMHSSDLKNSYFQIIKEDLSDHYPLAAYFTFEE